MAYNLTFTPEQWPGHVPFIDSAHQRFIRGGLTIDAAQVAAVLAAGEAAGQAVIRNNRLTLLQGSFLSLNPGTERYELYAPAFAATAATLATGVVADDNDLYWEAVAAGVAGNAIWVEIVDEMRGNPLPAVVVIGNDIKVILANPTSGPSTIVTGAAIDNNLVSYIARARGTAGDGIVITITDPGGDNDFEIDVDIAARTIDVQLETVGAAIQTDAATYVDALLADPRVMQLVEVVHGLDSDGTGDMAAEVATTAAGNDGDANIADNSADDIAVVVLANAAAAALVDVAEGVVGTGVVEEVGRTSLSGGAAGNQAVAAGLKTGNIAEETAINWRHEVPGAAGNAVQISYVHPGAGDNAFAVAIPGGNIVVTLQTVGGALVQTAAEVVAAIIADGTAAAIATPELGCAIGDAILQPMAATNMTGGVNEAAANIANRYACILFEDVDLQDGNGIATGIDHGRVLTARLPVAPDANVRAALPGVIFK